MGLKVTGMSASYLAVFTSVFAFGRSAISTLLTFPVEIETHAAKSGLVLVASH